MTREEFYIKIDQLAEEYSGVEKVLKLMELLTKYIVPLEQRNAELEQRVKELEEEVQGYIEDLAGENI